MATKVGIEFEADTKPIDKATESVKKTGEAAKTTEAQAKSLTNELQKQASAFLQVDKASSKVTGAIKDVAQSFNPLTFAAGGLAGIISSLTFGALKDMVTGVINARAELYKLHEQTGISVETLSGLKSIAAETGTSMETVAMLTQKFNQAVSTSDKSTSVQAEAFKNLGLQLKDSNGHFKDTLTLQMEAAKALNQHTDGIEKDAYYMAIWGKQAVQNKDYLKSLGEQTEISGKLTTEQAKQAHDLEIAITKLGKATGEFKNALANELVPWLLQTTTGLNDLIKAAGGLKIAFTNADLFGDYGSTLKGKLDEVEKTLSERKAKWANMAPWGRGSEEDFKAGIKQLEDRRLAIKRLMDIETDRAARARSEFAQTDPRLLGDPRATLKNIKEDKDKKDKEAPNLDKEIVNQRQRLEAMQGISEEQQIINRFADEYYKKYPPAQVAVLKNLELQQVGLKQTKELQDQLYNDSKSKFTQDKAIADQQNEALKSLKEGGEQYAIQVDVMKKYGATQDDVNIALNNYNILMAEKAFVDKANEGFEKGQEERMRNQIDLLRARGTQLEKNKVLNDAEIERQRTFEYGWERAFKNYENNATNAATEAADVFTTMSKSMEDAIVSFAMTGKINFKSFAASVIKNLVEIQAKKLAAGILGSLFGGASGANAPGGANFGMDLGFEANGGAYNRGIKFFAGGGVVSSRTGFGMASGGIGVMGEAGPEAIMPLKRGANGKLGVAAQGGGGGVTQVNNMSVHIGSVDSDERQQELMKEINNMIIATSKRTMADQMRKGNMLNPVR